ncbi:hypothetical protein [Aquihabitans sp. G128]|uniref:hypothetical protein n=1 Tax=Aquihabitans sp. G128 TaxID=2849779 RepID=UPI0020B1B851|nr:hypothetical protein [Aquihabitans sp. G128]
MHRLSLAVSGVTGRAPASRQPAQDAAEIWLSFLRAQALAVATAVVAPLAVPVRSCAAARAAASALFWAWRRYCLA